MKEYCSTCGTLGAVLQRPSDDHWGLYETHVIQLDGIIYVVAVWWR